MIQADGTTQPGIVKVVSGRGFTPRHNLLIIFALQLPESVKVLAKLKTMLPPSTRMIPVGAIRVETEELKSKGSQEMESEEDSVDETPMENQGGQCPVQ